MNGRRLLERAPLDLRVNVARTSRDELLARSSRARSQRRSAHGASACPSDSRIDDHPAFAEGLVEVQDEGSQLIALACSPSRGERLLDLCAGAGGKALALAAAAPRRSILATDSNRARLSKLAPRAERARRSDRDAAAQSRRTSLRELADWRGAGGRRARRCALLRKRNLAAQSGRPLAPDAGAARPGRRAASAPARHRGRAGPAGRAASSMRFARCCPAKGQAKLTDFLSRRSSWIVRGNANRRAGVWMVPDGF